MKYFEQLYGPEVYQKHYRETKEDYIDFDFKRVNKEDEHMFYKLPGMKARKDMGGVEERNEWILKGREKNIVFGDGPSATTMFLLSMFQILYPRDETKLACALAIFEFWNKHYKQIIEPGIHTWHEVMIIASRYVQHFDFVAWQWQKGNERHQKELGI